MALQETDNFMTQRGSDLYQVEAQALTDKMQDNDLLLVNRDRDNFKVAWSEIKDELGGGGGPGPGGIFPSDNDITISPSVLGSGTSDDPFILTPRISAPTGSTVLSSETISFNGQPIETDVIWTDNSSPDSGTRFTQPVTLTDSNGDWSGQLQYADAPDSTEDTSYIGDLQIGTLHFRWVVDQKLTDRIPTQVQSVDLVQSSDGRFTDGNFTFTSIIDDGAPLPTKTIEAYVSGTFDTEVTPKSSNSLTAGKGDIVAPVIAQSNIISGVNSWEAGRSPADYYAGEEWIGNDTDTAQSNVNYIEFLNKDGAGKPHVGPFTYNTSNGNTRWELRGVNGVLSDGANGNSLGPFTQQLTSDVVSIRILCPSGTANWSIKDFTINGVDIRNNETTQGTIITLTNNTVVEATTGEDTGLTVPEAFTPGLAVTSGDAIGTVVSASDSEITVDPDTNASWNVNANNSGAVYDSYLWAYGAGVYVSLTDTWPGLRYSYDGVVWTFCNTNVPGAEQTNYKANSVAYGNGKFVATRYVYNQAEYAKIFLSSTDGINWTTSAAPNLGQSSSYSQIKFIDGTFFCHSNYNASNLRAKVWWGNGSSWTGADVNPSQSLGNSDQLTNYSSMIGGNGQFVVFGQSGNQCLRYGDGKSTWNNTNLNLGYPANQKNGWCYGNNTFLITYYENSSKKFIRSTNGGATFNNISGGWFPKVIVYNEAVDTWYGWEANGDQIKSIDNGVTWSVDQDQSDPLNQWNNKYEWATRDPVNNVTKFVCNNNKNGNIPQFLDLVDAPVFKPGSPVEGATSIVETTKKYVEFNSNGAVSDLKGVPMDPPYTTTDTNPSLNLTFPSTFPSGGTPDEELPEGTVLTVGVFSENVVNRSPVTGYEEAIVQPVGPETVSDLFATTLYTGNGALEQITNGIDLAGKGGLVWTKQTDGTQPNSLVDTVRGENKWLVSNETAGETAETCIQNFSSTGYQAVGGATNSVNLTGAKFVSWCFRKTPKFFDAVYYLGSSSPQNIAHNLGSKPGFIIVKCTNYTTDWPVYHKDTFAYQCLRLNENYSAVVDDSIWNDIEPTTTEFTVGTDNIVNGVDRGYIAYLFADTPGLIKCGSYIGSGSSYDEVSCGFKPQWLLSKPVDDTGNPAKEDWHIIDDKRGVPANLQSTGETLFPNSSAEGLYDGSCTFTDDGFIPNGGNEFGKDGIKYIYVAIAAPVVESMTAEQFTETQAKFLTYDNRKQVKEGDDALAAREQLVKEATDLGLTTEQIEKVFNNG